MKKIKWFLKLIGITLSMCWRGYVSYMGRAALIHGVGLIVGYLGDFTVLYAMITSFPGLGGFNAYEVCFMYAMGLTAYALGNLHTRRFWQIDDIIQRGELDSYLIRPISPLLQLFVWDIQVGYISHLILGVGSMLLMKGLLDLSWGIDKWLIMFLSLISGGLLMSGLSLIGTPFVFWWGRSDSVTSLLRHEMREFMKYPVSAFPDAVRKILFIIPYAFVNFLPCVYLFGKSDAAYVPWIPLITMTAGVAINVLFWIFWRAGLRRYNSAGG